MVFSFPPPHCRYFCVISGYRSGSNAAATGVKKAQPPVFLHFFALPGSPSPGRHCSLGQHCCGPCALTTHPLSAIHTSFDSSHRALPNGSSFARFGGELVEWWRVSPWVGEEMLVMWRRYLGEFFDVSSRLWCVGKPYPTAFQRSHSRQDPPSCCAAIAPFTPLVASSASPGPISTSSR